MTLYKKCLHLSLTDLKSHDALPTIMGNLSEAAGVRRWRCSPEKRKRHRRGEVGLYNKWGGGEEPTGSFWNDLKIWQVCCVRCNSRYWGQHININSFQNISTTTSCLFKEPFSLKIYVLFSHWTFYHNTALCLFVWGVTLAYISPDQFMYTTSDISFIGFITSYVVPPLFSSVPRSFFRTSPFHGFLFSLLPTISTCSPSSSVFLYPF